VAFFEFCRLNSHFWFLGLACLSRKRFFLFCVSELFTQIFLKSSTTFVFVTFWISGSCLFRLWKTCEGSVTKVFRGECYQNLKRGVYREGGVMKGIGGECHGLPSGNDPHNSGPIQWAHGGVGLKPSAAAKALRRRAPPNSGVLRVARGGSGATLRLPRAPLRACTHLHTHTYMITERHTCPAFSALHFRLIIERARWILGLPHHWEQDANDRGQVQRDQERQRKRERNGEGESGRDKAT